MHTLSVSACTSARGGRGSSDYGRRKSSFDSYKLERLRILNQSTSGYGGLSESSTNPLLSSLSPSSTWSRSKSLRHVVNFKAIGEGHDCGAKKCSRLVINVSGLKFETQLATLERFPNTKLGTAGGRLEFWDEMRNELFLDRHRGVFSAVLYYYQSGGRLNKPSDIPDDVFLDELEFYGIADESIRWWCDSEAVFYPHHEHRDDQNAISRSSTSNTRSAVWLLCNDPGSSRYARVIALFSVFFVALSIAQLCLETLPSYRDLVCADATKGDGDSDVAQSSSYSPAHRTSVGGDAGLSDGSYGRERLTAKIGWTTNFEHLNKSDDSRHDDGRSMITAITNAAELLYKRLGDLWSTTHSNLVEIAHCSEMVCSIWFCGEFVVRLVTCPDVCLFVRKVTNIFDLVSILPFFIGFAMNKDDYCNKATSSRLSAMRMLRLSRVLKLSKHSAGMRVLGKTMRSSIRELLMFFFFLVVAMVIFSSAVFYAEAGVHGSQFTSIPQAFWWAIVTMTTVGYGDLVPVGAWGKLVGTTCVIAGVLTIALPVPVVVANFNAFYRKEIRKN